MKYELTRGPAWDAPDPMVAKDVFSLAVQPFFVFRHGCTDAAAR
jgi:hypothetical protein